MIIFLNGNYIDEKDARISPYDHGFLYGMGAFETLRTYKGTPFLLNKHLDRLARTLDEMRIDVNLSEEYINNIIANLLRENSIEDGYFRLNVSAGEAPIGLPRERYKNPTVMCMVKTLNSIGDTLVEKEAKILDLRRNTPEGKQRWKTHHYLNNILGFYEMEEEINKEGIYLTSQGYLAEGIVSNLFFVRDQVVYTPSLDTGILNGVTRARILEICGDMEIKCEQGHFPLNQLLEADEVFLTNSIQGIVAVSRIEDNQFVGKQGPITNMLFMKYAHQVGQ